MDSTGRITKRLSGFHHDLHWRDVGRNFLKLKNQIYDKGKHVLQADLAGAFEDVTKTFFPKHWSSEKVVEKITEALKVLERVEETGNKLRFVGKTKCGIRISFVTDSYGQLITAFPII